MLRASLTITKKQPKQLYLNMTVNGLECSIASFVHPMHEISNRNGNSNGRYTNLSTFWCLEINCGSATCLFVQANDDQYHIKYTYIRLLYSFNQYALIAHIYVEILLFSFFFCRTFYSFDFESAWTPKERQRTFGYLFIKSATAEFSI